MGETMTFEFLVNKDNKVSWYKESPCEWGKKEKQYPFKIIKKELSDIKYAKAIKYNYVYDENKQDFVNKYTGEVFYEGNLIDTYPYTTEKVAIRHRQLYGTNTSTACIQISQKYVSLNGPAGVESDVFKPIREYYLERFRPFLEYEGIKEAMLAILHGYYVDIVEAFNALPESTQEVLWTNINLTDDDRVWLRDVLGVTSKWLQ